MIAPSRQPFVHSGDTLAERLRYLFQVRLHPEEHREYRVDEVAATFRTPGARANIYQILSGKNTNPRRETLMSLAIFFRVPISHFYPELDNVPIDPLPDWE